MRSPGKDINIIVPTNCYGGTNDQARRVARCIANVQVVDLDVDGKNDMVQSIDRVLDTLASEDASYSFVLLRLRIPLVWI